MSETPTQPFAAPTMTLPEALQRANAHWQAGQAAQAEQLCQRILTRMPSQGVERPGDALQWVR